MKVNQDGIVKKYNVARKFDGEKDFDKYYIDRVVKQVVNITGEGEDDYIIVDKVIETKRDIAQVINAQADDVGVDAYMRPYLQSGESIPAVKVEEKVQDFTQMPETLADAVAIGERAKAAFKTLDPKLTKGKSYEEFILSMTQEAFSEYIKSFIPKKEETQTGKDK